MISRVFTLVLVLIGAENLREEPLQNQGVFDARALPEVSGIVKSRRYEDTYWVHNDSGNSPELYAVKRDGSIIRRYPVEIANIDWEDIAIDNDGHLYLGDIGNNGGHLPVRFIHQIDEPDPSKAVERPLRAVRSTAYSFERGKRFDAESLFVDDGKVFVIAKLFDGHEAEVYEISFKGTGSFLRPVLPVKRGTLPGFHEPATGADLSADGRRLVVCSSSVSRIYEGGVGQWKLVARVSYPSWSVEGVCWDESDILLAGEDRRLRRLSSRTWQSQPIGDIKLNGLPVKPRVGNSKSERESSKVEAGPSTGARRY